jgi:hypothetical protein
MGVMGMRRLVLAGFVSLCALAGSVLFSAPVALAVTPPVVEEESVLNVAGTSATFHATINPEGSETTYRFEYGTSEAYGSSVPAPDGLVGSGSVSVPVSAHAQDLAPATQYHYRVVAVVASRGETVLGSDGTFTTQPAGGEFALPDGRQWELVTPPNKRGARILPLASNGALTQAAEDGGAIMYAANVPTELAPAGYAGRNETRSVRGAQGWSSRDIAVPHSSTTGLPPDEYIFGAGDLSLSVAFPLGNDTVAAEDRTLLSSEATEQTPYIRRESLCDAPSTESECYLPVLTGKEGFADVPPGTVFGGTRTEGGNFSIVQFGGATSDLSHVVMVSRGPALTATPLKGGDGLYEWSAGMPASEAVQLVSVLPESEGGGAAPGHNAAGESYGRSGSGSRFSISRDGSRIFWGSKDEGDAFYLRDLTRKETIRLDVPQSGIPVSKTPLARFQIASSDGSRVFFTDEDQEQRLTAQSGTQGPDLYECEIVEQAGKLACNLTDVTPASGGQSAEVRHLVVGGSEDASSVYFVANGVLGDGAEHGGTRGTCKEGLVETGNTCNLYEYHDGAITYIATLSEADENDWGRNKEEYGNIGEITARVSSNGRYLAFMSQRSLTGYDNRDAVSGSPDEEVYLYDSVSRRLACVSCNPTGSRPTGIGVEDFVSSGRVFSNIADLTFASAGPKQWFAADLPGGGGLNGGDGLYQPRELSDSGRVFFNSIDALVSQDVNGDEDVYEFEPEGVGGCSAGSVTFNPATGGCVSLISSGTAPGESGLLDTSVGGGDVFLLTKSRLTSQDSDTAYDVYTAHECTAAVPCVSQPVSPPPCDSGDSCKAAPALQPSLFGAPASETFSGSGNVVTAPGSPVVKSKSLTRAQKLARALRACGKQPRKRRRACQRKAHRRFGAGAARVSAGVTRKGQG